MNAGDPLKCTSPEDVYLLLKSSDFISHDLDHAYDDCVDLQEGRLEEFAPKYHLVLKKWFAMPRSHEFRCFVRDEQLIGKCATTWISLGSMNVHANCCARTSALTHGSLSNEAISARDTNYYDFLQERTRQSRFVQMINDFYIQKIRGNFPTSHCQLFLIAKTCASVAHRKIRIHNKA